MNLTAAGQRFVTFSCSCIKLAGGRTIRLVSRSGFSIASRKVNSGFILSFAINRPCKWQERNRSCSITGVLLASDNRKPISTESTIAVKFGRGSNNQICDFIAKACDRSCMIEEPSP